MGRAQLRVQLRVRHQAREGRQVQAQVAQIGRASFQRPRLCLRTSPGAPWPGQEQLESQSPSPLVPLGASCSDRRMDLLTCEFKQLLSNLWNVTNLCHQLK